MKLINIHLYTTPSANRTYKYKVEYNLNGTWNLAHTGKFFCEAGQSDVQLDLEDILINYRYMGNESIKPVLSVDNNQYQMPTGAATVLTDCYYNQVRVVSMDTTLQFSTVSKSFYFLPVDMFGYSFSMPLGLSIPAVSGGLLPRIPSNPPAGFYFSTMAFNNSAYTLTVTVKRDSTTVSTPNVYTYRGEYIPLSGATEAYYIDNIKVAQVDQCTSPYYLLWLTNNGGLQCQPFLKTSKFSVSYSNKTAVDIRNAEWKISSTAEAKWNLKSKNLTDEEYRIYGELFNSPYLVLLDMENNNLHYVNVSKSTYEQKQRTRKDTKPIYFEIEVKSADKIRV